MVTEKEVLQRFYNTHGDMYDYSKMGYSKMNTKVEIICSDHGSFFSTPKNHSRGRGCPECKRITLTLDITKRLKYLEDATDFDYSNVKYTVANEKVEIVCKLHGTFLSRLNNVTDKSCLKCNKENYNKSYFVSSTKFRNRLESSDFELGNIKYTGNHNNIELVCKDHGSFHITPSNFILGIGCKKCSRSLHGNPVSLYTNDRELGQSQGIFYKLLFTNKEHDFSFMKIGITRKTIESRYNLSGDYKGYTYEIIDIIEATNLETSLLERDYKTQNKPKRVEFPNGIKFNGYTECYNY